MKKQQKLLVAIAFSVLLALAVSGVVWANKSAATGTPVATSGAFRAQVPVRGRGPIYLFHAVAGNDVLRATFALPSAFSPGAPRARGRVPAASFRTDLTSSHHSGYAPMP